MNTIAKVLIQSVPLAVGILLSYLFWQNTMLLLAIYLVVSAGLIVTGRDRRIEALIFLYGLVVGFVIETIGTGISGYQSFTKPDILTIPYWLIVTWGFGFVLMKRIGFIISTGSPWASRS
jgi:hypothetical protein